MTFTSKDRKELRFWQRVLRLIDQYGLERFKSVAIGELKLMNQKRAESNQND